MAVTWTNTIKGFFRQYDIDHMKLVTNGAIDLSSYDNVKTNIEPIWDRIQSGSMPPGGGWSRSKQNTFQSWMNGGMPQDTWQSKIKNLFTSLDIEHMKQITGNALKLDDYESTKTWAGQIWRQVSQGFMPPGGPWPKEKRDTFEAWKNGGMPE